MTHSDMGPAGGRGGSRRGGPPGTTAVLVGVQLLLVLDTTVITSATPVMSRQLHTGVGRVSLAQGVYALAFGGLLLLGGWCADRFGALRTLRWALGAFALSGGAVTMVGAIGPVIALRALQGACAALAAPATLALLIDLPPRRARRALGWFAAVGAIGLALGVGLGTPLIAAAGWRAGFTGPAVIALALLIGTVPLGRGRTGGGRRSAGADGRPPVLLSAAVTVLLAAAEAALLARSWWTPLAALAAASPLLLAVLRADAGRTRPVIPPSMTAATTARAGLVLMTAFGGWQAAEVLLVAVRLDSLRAAHPWLAGLPFWLQGAAALLCAPAVQRLCESGRSLGPIMTLSPCAAGLGFIVIGATRSTGPAAACAATVVFGVAAVSASTAATLTTASAADAPPGRIGAVMTSARQLGTSVGTCIVGALLGAPLGSPGRACALAAGAVVIVLGLAASPRDRRA